MSFYVTAHNSNRATTVLFLGRYTDQKMNVLYSMSHTEVVLKNKCMHMYPCVSVYTVLYHKVVYYYNVYCNVILYCYFTGQK